MMESTFTGMRYVKKDDRTPHEKIMEQYIKEKLAAQGLGKKSGAGKDGGEGAGAGGPDGQGAWNGWSWVDSRGEGEMSRDGLN